MIWHILLYNALFLSSCCYAAVRGGAPERIGSGIAVAATILSALSLQHPSIAYNHEEWTLLAVDVGTLLGFGLLMLYADRYWPMYATGLQAVAVLIHACKIINPDMARLGFAIGLSIWSYPILIMLAVGTRRHRRRVSELGIDPAWSPHSQSI